MITDINSEDRLVQETFLAGRVYDFVWQRCAAGAAFTIATL